MQNQFQENPFVVPIVPFLPNIAYYPFLTPCISNTIVSSGPPGPPGPPGPLIIPTVTVEADYTALTTDYFIGVITGAPYSITLPMSVDGTVYIVKDIFGEASTNPITVLGTSTTIDAEATATIVTDFGSIALVFNEGSWSIV